MVVVANEEATYFQRVEPVREAALMPSARDLEKAGRLKGFTWPYVQINDRQLSLHLINTTDFTMTLPYWAKEANGNFKGVSSGSLERSRA